MNSDEETRPDVLNVQSVTRRTLFVEVTDISSSSLCLNNILVDVLESQLIANLLNANCKSGVWALQGYFGC